MPIYEYSCPKCGEFEITQRITEDALTRCPTCRSKVKKLISNTSFQLKGSGWYITDYARKDSGKGTEKAAEKATNAKETGSTGSANSESSAATKADSPAAKEKKPDKKAKAA